LAANSYANTDEFAKCVHSAVSDCDSISIEAVVVPKKSHDVVGVDLDRQLAYAHAHKLMHNMLECAGSYCPSNLYDTSTQCITQYATAVHYCALPCVAVCCRVLPCVAVCCRVLPCATVRVLHPSLLSFRSDKIATHCDSLQYVVVCCYVLPYVAKVAPGPFFFVS